MSIRRALIGPSRFYVVILDEAEQFAEAFDRALAWSWYVKDQRRFRIIFTGRSIKEAVKAARTFNQNRQD